MSTSSPAADPCATRPAPRGRNSAIARTMVNKVPEITLYFWIIKIMATTVGETFADYLNLDLGFGLNNTTYVMGALLLVALGFQFKADKYVPPLYWLAVVFISVVGTLITDNMTDNLGVPLVVSTVGFAVALAMTFAVWFASERTLSIHSIITSKREGFYWLAILFTFALGTAAGDLVGEGLALGYLPSLLIFGAVIAVIAVAHLRFGVNAVLSFWLAYILTRPLGASLGDYLSQARADGGLAIGATATSAVFLVTILALVSFLTITKRDRTPAEVVAAEA